MVISLTGFMGSGKSSVGRALADLLGCRFIDLDDAIVRKAGKSIPDIFAEKGESGFRILESKALKTALPEGGTAVIALGGGTLTHPSSAALIRGKTYCVYLRASVDTLVARLEDEAAERPLLQGGTLRDRIAALLSERAETYEKTAHDSIDTDGMTPEEIAEELILTYL